MKHQTQNVSTVASDARDIIETHTSSMRAVIDMLIIVYGGELDEKNQPSDTTALGLFVYLQNAASDIEAAALTLERATGSQPLLLTDIWSVMAITSTIVLVLEGFDLEMPFGMTTIDGLLCAIRGQLASIEAGANLAVQGAHATHTVGVERLAASPARPVDPPKRAVARRKTLLEA